MPAERTSANEKAGKRESSHMRGLVGQYKHRSWKERFLVRVIRKASPLSITTTHLPAPSTFIEFNDNGNAVEETKDKNKGVVDVTSHLSLYPPLTVLDAHAITGSVGAWLLPP